jgi:hypothetical protein
MTRIEEQRGLKMCHGFLSPRKEEIARFLDLS